MGSSLRLCKQEKGISGRHLQWGVGGRWNVQVNCHGVQTARHAGRHRDVTGQQDSAGAALPAHAQQQRRCASHGRQCIPQQCGLQIITLNTLHIGRAFAFTCYKAGEQPDPSGSKRGPGLASRCISLLWDGGLTGTSALSFCPPGEQACAYGAFLQCQQWKSLPAIMAGAQACRAAVMLDGG